MHGPAQDALSRSRRSGAGMFAVASPALTHRRSAHGGEVERTKLSTRWTVLFVPSPGGACAYRDGCARVPDRNSAVSNARAEAEGDAFAVRSDGATETPAQFNS